MIDDDNDLQWFRLRRQNLSNLRIPTRVWWHAIRSLENSSVHWLNLRFPKIGVPPNHPFLAGWTIMNHHKPSIWRCPHVWKPLETPSSRRNLSHGLSTWRNWKGSKPDWSPLLLKRQIVIPSQAAEDWEDQHPHGCEPRQRNGQPILSSDLVDMPSLGRHLEKTWIL